MIKAVIFDCFGVLVGSGFHDLYTAAGGDALKDRDFIGEMLYKANSGSISDAEFNRDIVNRLGISIDQYRETVSREQQLNRKLFGFIQEELLGKFKIGLLSNANSGEIERKIPVNLRKLFDVIVVSGEVGLLKPDPEIFKLAALRLGIEPEEAVFIDDLERYVNAAEMLGMKTIQYKDFESFKTKIGLILNV